MALKKDQSQLVIEGLVVVGDLVAELGRGVVGAAFDHVVEHTGRAVDLALRRSGRLRVGERARRSEETASLRCSLSWAMSPLATASADWRRWWAALFRSSTRMFLSEALA